jgi:cysteine synthase A
MKNFEDAAEPAILDWSVVDHVLRVDDNAAYATTKRLFREEALIVGPTTGAIVHAAAEFGADRHGIAVGVSPDGGQKYTTYFQDLLGDEGLPRV